MSRSESEAGELIPPMIRGEEIRWNCAEQESVARWTFKTALMLDRSSLSARVAPLDHFRTLFEQQRPPESITIYTARYFPSANEDHLAVIGSCFKPTNVDPRLYPDPYQITFSVGQAVFQVFGHSGTARLEIRRAGHLKSGLVVPLTEVFQQLWPIRADEFVWPPDGGQLDTASLQTLAR